jgi:hypothetical protein
MTDVAVTSVTEVTRVATTDDEPPVVVNVTAETYTAATTEETTRVVTVARQGPPGTPGADGIGAPYVHTQTVPADVWVIDHTLGHEAASIAVYDSTGSEVTGDAVNTSPTRVTVSFSGAFAGVARLL